MATSLQVVGVGGVVHVPFAEKVGRATGRQSSFQPALNLRSFRVSSVKPPQTRSCQPQRIAAGGCLQPRCNKIGLSSFKGSVIPAAGSGEKLARDRRKGLHVVSEAGLADEQDRGERQEPVSGFSKEMMVPTSMAKIGTQFGGGSATLERGKLDLHKEAAVSTPKVDDGSGGGNKGKDLGHGGGDGGDDGGDDDDYFDDFDDDGDGGDDGFFARRTEVVELFDRATIEAVLQEWYRTVTGLPGGVRRAVEMGMVSSAQLVRLLNTDCRPSVARAITRHTPPDFARAFLGRLMADPAFLWKLGLEQVFTIGNAAYWEIKQRGSRLKDEWDLAVVNVLTLAAANAVINWSVAPCRKYHEPFRWEWQNTLQKLPHNAFDKSYTFAELSRLDRFYGFAYKSAELCAMGSVLGSVGGLVQNALLTVRRKVDRKFNPSVAVPSVGVSSLGYGAFMGLSGNLRYQLVGGLERFLLAKYSHIGFVTLGSTLARFSNVRLGEPTRLHWLGLDSGAAAFRRKHAGSGGLLEKAGAFFRKKGVKMTVKKGKGKGKLKAKAPAQAPKAQATPAPVTSAPQVPQEARKPRYRVRKRPELETAAA